MSDADLPLSPHASPAAEPQSAGPAAVPPASASDAEHGFGPRLRDLDKDIERELAEAMGGLTAKELLGEPVQRMPRAPAAEGPKKGTIMRIHGADVFVDVPGGRGQGVLPLLQFPDGPPALGSAVEISIEGYDEANGLLLLSRRGAAQSADWSTVAEGMIVEARVTATNKGGLSVDVNGIRGFMPISQIDLYRVDNPEQFVNQRLRCLVTEVKPDERNLVVSARALMEKEREETREKLWQELAEGQVREGVVRSIRDFGAFVNLGGVDGLLHISEMSWARVADASTVVQQGERIKVIVLKIDREKRKISLGLRQLTASPWDQADASFPIGAVINAKITRLMEFRAFAELEPGIEGLIHISELAPQRVRRVADVVQVGQEVQVRILRVDHAQHKISLSLKQAAPKEAPAAEEEPEEETEVKAPRPRTTPLRGGIGDG